MKKRHLFAGILACALTLTLAACGLSGADVTTYIQGELDCTYKGQYSQEYLDLVDGMTEEDAKQQYEDNAQAEAQLSAVDWPQYDDVLFLSKSIGTAVSAAFAQRHGIPCRQILYTPLSLTFALAPQNALAFLGTADPWSDASSVAAAARANGTPLCLYENATQSLETGDVLHDLATLQDVMQKTQTFIADTPH